jgi:glycosyltransferase involved in cell wall biosynthesis
MVSVIILAKNEERDLPACLESLRWCDDIHILDSGSTDRTPEIAKAHGASILSNHFQSFGTQRNWAIDNCPVQHGWILFLDADERSTPEFQAALLEAISQADEDCAGFYCCWKMMLRSTWLKRADNFPKWQFRLFRKGRARFIDVGHGQKEGATQGRIDYLREPYLHYAFSGGWQQWETRHRSYAKEEACERRRKLINPFQIFSPHASRRNPAIKQWLGNLPGWPWVRFFYSYFLKGGWLEGPHALEYCKKIKWYENLIQEEMRSMPKPQATHQKNSKSNQQ